MSKKYNFEVCKQAILQTLVYSDLFHYPLKREEVWRFLKSKHKVSKKVFLQSFKELLPTLIYQHGYICLPKSQGNIIKRKGNQKESKIKYSYAKKISGYLSLVPTIQFIGISGSVAAGNANEADDIDLFIIVEKGTLWISRILILGILELLRARRTRISVNAHDKVCVNMLLDTSSLMLPEERHDFYSAHEIVQMKPLFERNEYYRKFLSANDWIINYMPNSLSRYKVSAPDKKYPRNFLGSILSFIFISGFELIARWIQLWKIQKTRSTETVSDTLLAFHPFDYRLHVLSRYEKRLSALELV